MLPSLKKLDFVMRNSGSVHSSPREAVKARIMDSHVLGTWNNALYRNDIDAFRELLDQNPAILKERDSIGSAPLHLALLYNSDESVDLVRDLIQDYPERCGDQYIGTRCLPLCCGCRTVPKDTRCSCLSVFSWKERARPGAGGCRPIAGGYCLTVCRLIAGSARPNVRSWPPTASGCR